jgi:hypothetical protein
MRAGTSYKLYTPGNVVEFERGWSLFSGVIPKARVFSSGPRDLPLNRRNA